MGFGRKSLVVVVAATLLAGLAPGLQAQTDPFAGAQRFTDPAGDTRGSATDPRADIVEHLARLDENTILLAARTAGAEPPTALGFRNPGVGPVFLIDVENDGSIDFSASLYGTEGGSVGADVFERGANGQDTFRCPADAAFEQSFYVLRVGATCMDEPETFHYRIFFGYGRDDDGSRTFDTAPDSGFVGPITPPPAFRDIGGSVHEESISAVARAGVASGYPDGTFRPEGIVTRGQMAAFLVRARSLPPAPGHPGFLDTRGSSQEAAIKSVAAAGVASGYADGTFRPGDLVTRAQMATFLTRAFSLPAAPSHPGFADTRGDFHEGSIRSVAQAGIAAASPDGRYRPASPITRGQMATFLARALGLVPTAR